MFLLLICCIINIYVLRTQNNNSKIKRRCVQRNDSYPPRNGSQPQRRPNNGASGRPVYRNASARRRREAQRKRRLRNRAIIVGTGVAILVLIIVLFSLTRFRPTRSLSRAVHQPQLRTRRPTAIPRCRRICSRPTSRRLLSRTTTQTASCTIRFTFGTRRATSCSAATTSTPRPTPTP